MPGLQIARVERCGGAFQYTPEGLMMAIARCESMENFPRFHGETDYGSPWRRQCFPDWM